MYWAVLTLGPVLIGGSLSMTSFAIGALGSARLRCRRVLGVLPFVFTCTALTLLYIVVPYRHVDVRDALIGGVLAGVAFEIAKRGFAVYVARFPTYTLVYGAFATLPIFLPLALHVLGGGAGRRALHRDAARRTADAEGARAASRARSHRRARCPGRAGARAGRRPVRLRRIAAQAAGHAAPLRGGARALPARLGWPRRTDKDGWVLARDAGYHPRRRRSTAPSPSTPT